MVRIYKRKTDRALMDENVLQQAVRAVLGGQPLRQAAREYNMKRSTLQSRVKVARELQSSVDSVEDGGPVQTTKVLCRSKFRGRQVFDDREEKLLEDYLIKAAKICFGLTYKMARELAFQYAKSLNNAFPSQWERERMAGKEWMIGFMKRHVNLSLRKPENTSMARCLSFSQVNVKLFFENYVEVLHKFNFPPQRILNLDETGINTVLPNPRIISKSGTKQVGACASQERGEQVSLVGIITAAGQAMPPIYIFPRVKNKDEFLDGAPPGSLGLAAKSGFMNGELFIDVLKHIKKHTFCTTSDPLLILLENHKSHTTLEAINFSRENGITIVSFPPHCSHRMQPLDLTVFGPFKCFLKTALSDFVKAHPGRLITIRDVAKLSNEPFLSAFSPKNIIAGFKKPCIWPLNRLAFTEDDFPQYSDPVMEEPLPTPAMTSGATKAAVTVAENRTPSTLTTSSLEPGLSVSLDYPRLFTPITPNKDKRIENATLTPAELKLSTSSTSGNVEPYITPEHLRPLLRPVVVKSGDAKPIVRSTIYTSTPEKTKAEQKRAIEQEKEKEKQRKREEKKLSKGGRPASTAEKRKAPPEKPALPRVTAKKMLFDDESDSSSSGSLEDECFERPLPLDRAALAIGHWVVVTYNGGDYPGRVIKLTEMGPEIECLEKKNRSWRWPLKKDVLLYEWEMVKYTIRSPQENKRGFLTVPELNQFVGL